MYFSPEAASTDRAIMSGETAERYVDPVVASYLARRPKREWSEGDKPKPPLPWNQSAPRLSDGAVPYVRLDGSVVPLPAANAKERERHEERFGKIDLVSAYPQTPPSLPAIIGLFDGNRCRRCGMVVEPDEQQAEWIYLGRDPVTAKAKWKRGEPKHLEMHEAEDADESLRGWLEDRAWDQASYLESLGFGESTQLAPEVRNPRSSKRSK